MCNNGNYNAGDTPANIHYPCSNMSCPLGQGTNAPETGANANVCQNCGNMGDAVVPRWTYSNSANQQLCLDIEQGWQCGDNPDNCSFVIDVDECENGNPCAVKDHLNIYDIEISLRPVCTNTIGSHNCSECANGYSMQNGVCTLSLIHI